MSCKRILLGFLCIALTMVLAPRTVRSQRNAVEGLYRGFVVSRVEKDRQQVLQRQRASDWHRRTFSTPTPTVQPTAASPQLLQYRGALRTFATNTAALANSLQRVSSTIRGVRPLMGDLLKVKTTAAVMYEQSQKSNDLNVLREQYRGLDSEWRALSFRLQKLPGLDSNTGGQIHQLDRHSDAICTFFQIPRQFDRMSTSRLASETSGYLRALLDDIEIELQGQPNANGFAGECRGLAEQCQRLSVVAVDATYDDLVTKYSSFVSDWRKFAAKLYPFENPSCDRRMRRIRHGNQLAFQKLRLQPSIDRAYLAHVSRQMEREVSSLLDNMSVKTLLQLSSTQQQALLTTSRQLHVRCQHFRQRVDNNSPLKDLIADVTYIDDQWHELGRYLNSNVQGPANSRQLIAAYDNELREILGVPPRLNHAQAIQLAASLEEMARHMQYDVRRFGRYYRSPANRDQAYRSSDAFITQVHNLHANLGQRTSAQDLQSNARNTVAAWDSFSNAITAMPANGISPTRYQYINESRQEVLPVIAELATLLGS